MHLHNEYVFKIPLADSGAIEAAMQLRGMCHGSVRLQPTRRAWECYIDGVRIAARKEAVMQQLVRLRVLAQA